MIGDHGELYNTAVLFHVGIDQLSMMIVDIVEQMAAETLEKEAHMAIAVWHAEHDPRARAIREWIRQKRGSK